MIQEQAPIGLINSPTLNYLKASLLYKVVSLVQQGFTHDSAPWGSSRASSVPQQVLQREMLMFQLQLTPTCSRSPLTRCSGHSSQGESKYFLWNLKYWVTKCSNDLGEAPKSPLGFYTWSAASSEPGLPLELPASTHPAPSHH